MKKTALGLTSVMALLFLVPKTMFVSRGEGV
jgi:hypothetical protein